MKGELKQILSVSRRTDIPAFYMAWFMDQVARGFIEVINPFNRQVKRVAVSPEAGSYHGVLVQKLRSLFGRPLRRTAPGLGLPPVVQLHR
jgi:hypothetical protein